MVTLLKETMQKQHRRRFMTTVGATGFGIGLAGCMSSGSETEEPIDSSDDEDGTPADEDGEDGDGTDTPDDPEEPGELIEDFEGDLELWRDLDAYGEFEVETEDVYEGTQALRIRAAENEPYVGVTRAFSEPLDMRGKNISLAFKATEPEIYRVSVRLLAPGQGNMVHLNRTHTGPTGDWLRVDMGATGETGNPDLSEVYALQIVGYPRDEGQVVDYTIGDIRTVDAPDRGKVMLTWDDNHESQWDVYEIHQEYGFPGVAGVIHHAVGKSDRLDTTQLRQMQSDGWEIVSHPHPQSNWSAPLSEFDETRQRQIIEDSHRWLRQRGFEAGANHYIAPGNTRDATNLDVLRDVHESSMSFGGGNVGVPLSDPHTIGRIDGSNLETVKEYVDLAAKYNQLCVPMWHVLGEQYDNHEITAEEYRELLDYIDAADVDVVTPSELESVEF